MLIFGCLYSSNNPEKRYSTVLTIDNNTTTTNNNNITEDWSNDAEYLALTK